MALQYGNTSLTADRAQGNWQELPIKVTRQPPVILAMTNTYAGRTLPGLRIKPDRAGRFYARFDEVYSPSTGVVFADGAHRVERIGWAALSGDGGLPQGSSIRYGLIEGLAADRRAGNWHTVRFDPFLKGTPTILAATQTYYDPETPGLRIRDVKKGSFQIRFNEVVVDPGRPTITDGEHADNEEVGWMAFGSGPVAPTSQVPEALAERSGRINGLAADRASDSWYEVTFDPPFGGRPLVFAMTQSYVDAETPGLRIKDVNATSFKIRFDEINGIHASATDGAHSDREVVGWAAYGPPPGNEA